MRVRVMFSCVFAMLVSGVSAAQAQDSVWGDLSVSAARIDYDLGRVGNMSGVGQTNGIVVRANRSLTSNLSVEFGGVFAQPHQEFGSGTLFMPEAQLQYRWTVGRLEPYVGAGLGLSAMSSSGLTDWAPTTSAAVGTAVRLTDRIALTGELRVRGHEWRFTGSTGEFSAGLAWRLPSF